MKCEYSLPIVKIFYNHETRKIYDKETKVELSFEKAKKMWYDDNIRCDCNIAFITLLKFNGNMNEVEKFYQKVEKYHQKLRTL